MRMRSNSLLLMLGKSDLTVFVFSCRVFMWGFWQIWVGDALADFVNMMTYF